MVSINANTGNERDFVYISFNVCCNKIFNVKCMYVRILFHYLEIIISISAFFWPSYRSFMEIFFSLLPMPPILHESCDLLSTESCDLLSTGVSLEFTPWNINSVDFPEIYATKHCILIKFAADQVVKSFVIENYDSFGFMWRKN